MTDRYQFYCCLVLIIASYGCAGLKNISSEDPLFIGNDFKLIDGGKKARRSIREASNYIQPVPNDQLLWMRPALARNNMLSDSAKRKKFWKNKVAEPVQLSQTRPHQASESLQNRFFHEGFFGNSITFEVSR